MIVSLGARKSLKYWGFRHQEQIVLGVMETLDYPLRELVKKQGCGYEFTCIENTSYRVASVGGEI